MFCKLGCERWTDRRGIFEHKGALHTVGSSLPHSEEQPSTIDDGYSRSVFLCISRV